MFRGAFWVSWRGKNGYNKGQFLKDTPMSKPSILLVDDNPDNIYLLEVILQSRNFTTYSATNGREAVEIVKDYPGIDLILMDVMMPEMDGFEASRHIRNRTESAHIPIIMMTAKKRELGDVVRGLDEGALEYLTKPFEEEELLARVRSMLRIKRLHDNNRELLDKLLAQQKLMDMELKTAEKVQYAMLPAPGAYPAKDRITVETHYRAAASIGGDFYDIMEYGQGKVAFLIADVSGHGPSAALIVAVLKTILVNEAASRPSPAEMMTRINKKLTGLIPEDHFISAFFAVADLDARTLTGCRAGHPFPMLFSAQRQEIVSLDTPGSILGMFSDAVFGENSVALVPGDKLLLYSDGIFEVPNKAGELYGLPRLREFVQNHRADDCHALLDKMNAEVDAFWDGETIRDDVAELAVEFK